MAGIACAALCLAGSAPAAPPDFNQVKAAWQPSEAWLLDRHDRVLHELRIDQRIRRTDWVPLSALSPALIGAVLHAEDQRFFSHGGVDWLAVSHAALTNLFNDRPRGASTLTMQLAALLDAQLRARKGRRGIGEKWDQMQAARELDAAWSKAQILEAYFNLLPMRGDLVGIDAASRALFDKRPAGLGPAEAIVLAALIRSPNAKATEVAKRACALGAGLDNAPDCPSLTRLSRNSLTGRHPISAAVDLAPHLASQLLKQPGSRLRTSLDADLQRHVRRLLDEQLTRLEPRHVQDAAALVLDNRSGAVLAYVSQSSRTSAGGQTDGVRAPRQAGSTLKPFLYALAIERRYLTAASPLDDRPLSVATGGGQYVPQNYDRQYRGQASLRQALASSLNIPAVNTLELVGEELFANRLARLGFDGLTEDADFYGPAMALGSLDVSLWQLTNAYRTLANGGLHSLPTLTPVAQDTRRVGRSERSEVRQRKTSRAFSPEAAYIVADILADRQARATTFGLESPLASRSWAAVKTGTSKDMRDNWCIGFTDRYTVGVWIGNFDGSPMHDVSGVAGAAPTWRDIIDYLHLNTPSQAPKAPVRLVRRKVVPADEPPRREWFLPGTEPTGQHWTVAQPPAEIINPGDGSLLAIDPDIPPERQRLTLKALHSPVGSRWQINGQDWAAADWPISRGRHSIALLDQDARELDRIEFEVR